MIVRPFTLISGLMFAVSGAYLFGVKHQSQMLDSQISAVNAATQQDEQSIRVLQAQWALEADPSRLAALAAQFTGLQPMKPSQLVTLADLGHDLPPPGSPVPGANPDDPVPAMPQIAAATPTPAQPVPAPSAPAQFASAKPAPATPAAAAPVRLAAVTPPPARPAPKPAAAPVAPATRVAVNTNITRRPVHPPRHEAASAVYMASDVYTPPHRPSPHAAPRPPVVHIADIAPPTPQPQPAPPPAYDGGSLLGMANGGGN
ncbi:hypothetical protein [Acidocella sp.]|uniref:cell division protein FtsL n=1 Tax=Acidocella sp. TaxID=50710 RepID=UPI002635E67E|nr:hypothetical protein [Acidocella sp.]